MKIIISLIFLFTFIFSFGQVNSHEQSFDSLCKNKYQINLNIGNEYETFSHQRVFIPTYVDYSCMPHFYKKAIINKKFKNNYVIYFEFNPTASSNYVDTFIVKYLNPGFSKNTNYLGGKLCEAERKQGIINVFTPNDFLKFNANDVLCIRPSQNAIQKNDSLLNNFIYVVIHKENIGDMYVAFVYQKESEPEVMNEIRNLWRIIQFQ